MESLFFLDYCKELQTQTDFQTRMANFDNYLSF